MLTCRRCMKILGKNNRSGNCAACAAKVRRPRKHVVTSPAGAEARAEAGRRSAAKLRCERTGRAGGHESARRQRVLRALAQQRPATGDPGRAWTQALLARRTPEEAAEDEADFRAWHARISPIVAEAMERRAAQVRAELPRKLREPRATPAE